MNFSPVNRGGSPAAELKFRAIGVLKSQTNTGGETVVSGMVDP
jgi:hypothetical protein